MSIITYEDEDLPEIEYYEILTLDEIIKDNPTFIAFSHDEIFNELYDFFKNTNKANMIADMFFKNNKRDIINYVFVSHVGKKTFDCMGDNLQAFADDMKKLSKLQYQMAQNEKNKYFFALAYDDKSESLRLKPHMKTTIALIDDTTETKINIYYPVFGEDQTNVPISAIYYRRPKCVLESSISSKITSYLDKQLSLNYLESDAYSEVEKMLKIVKPKMKTILEHLKLEADDYAIDYNEMDAFLKLFDTSLEDINIEDFSLLKDHVGKIIDELKADKVTHKKFKIKELTVKNDKIEFFNKTKNILQLLNFSDRIKEDYRLLVDTLQEEKMNINAPPLIYNNINDIVRAVINKEMELEEIIDNLAANRNVLIIDHAMNTLKSITENDIEKISVSLQYLTERFKLLKDAIQNINELHFIDFYHELKEIKEGEDYSQYDGIPDVFRNDPNYEGMAMGDDDMAYDEEEELVRVGNKELEKYWLSIKYKDASGFVESLKILLPVIDRIQTDSKLPLNYEILCEELYRYFAGLSTKFTLLRMTGIEMSDDNINDAIKLLPKVVMTTNLVSADIMSNLRECNKQHVHNLYDMLCHSIAWWSLQIQDNIVNNVLLFDENQMLVTYIDKWSQVDGQPLNRENNKKGVLPYIAAITDDVIMEDPYFSISEGSIMKDTMKIIDEQYNDHIISLREKAKNIHKKQNRGAESYMKLFETLTNKKKDRVLHDYVDALMYMPAYKFKKIHKYLHGCCLQKIGKDFIIDSDIIAGQRKDLISAKKIYAKRRETVKSRYPMYLPLSDNTEKDSFIPEINTVRKEYIDMKQQDDVDNMDNWLAAMYDKSPLLPNEMITMFYTSTKEAEVYTKHHLQCLTKTAGVKSAEFENLFMGEKSHKNILLMLLCIFTKYPVENDNEHKLFQTAIDAIRDISICMTNMSDFANQYNIQNINRIKDFIVSKCLCLPFNPSIANNKIMYPSIDVHASFANNVTKLVYDNVMKYLRTVRIPTAEENMNFINQIREENKNKILNVMNTKTPEERNLMNTLKKIGLGDAYEDNENVPQVDHGIDVQDDDQEGEREFQMHDQEDYDDNLDVEEYGFIYS
jgi:hypothetical protein